MINGKRYSSFFKKSVSGMVLICAVPRTEETTSSDQHAFDLFEEGAVWFSQPGQGNTHGFAQVFHSEKMPSQRMGWTEVKVGAQALEEICKTCRDLAAQ